MKAIILAGIIIFIGVAVFLGSMITPSFEQASPVNSAVEQQEVQSHPIQHKFNGFVVSMVIGLASAFSYLFPPKWSNKGRQETYKAIIFGVALVFTTTALIILFSML